MSKDLLDKENRHLLTQKLNNGDNSFIANVNKVAQNLEAVTAVKDLFTEEDVANLAKLADIDISVLIQDINKGSLNGYRKLDIDLLKNFADYSDSMTDEEKQELWNDPTKQVYYDSITIEFNDKTALSTDFTESGVAIVINNHDQLYAQLENWAEFRAKSPYTMFNLSPDTPIYEHELLRMWDGEGEGSTVDAVTLHVAPEGQNQSYDAVFAGARDYSPSYSWTDTTSALEVIVQKIGDIISVGVSIDQVATVSEYLSELSKIYSVLDMLASTDPKIMTIYSELDKLVTLYNNLEELLPVSEMVATIQELETSKANKISTTAPVDYSITYSIPSNSPALNYVVGDILTSGTFTFTVTNVTDEGVITNGTLSPLTSDTDLTGEMLFTKADNPTSLILDIVCTPSEDVKVVSKDLSDVYDEVLDNKAAIDDLHSDFEELEDEFELLEKIVEELDVGAGGGSVSNFVRKTSTTPQVINSDLVLDTGKALHGTKTDTTTHTLLQSARLSTQNNGSSVIRDVVSVGNTGEHLHLNTNNDSVYGDSVTVLTPNGVKSLTYKEDVSDTVAVNFLLGSCIPLASEDIPEQTKLAVGNEYNVEDYPEAAKKLGTRYGGDGINTFGTPDLRNEPPTSLTWVIVLGKDNGSSTRFYCGREGLYCGMEGLYCGMQISS